MSALASSNVCLKLTPSIGDCVTPRICSGGSIPRHSSTVGTMSMACANCCPDLALRLDPLRPVNQERIAHAAAIRFALPAPEGRVPGECPAPRIMIEVFRAAQFVKRLEILLHRLRNIVEELVFVDRPVRSALGARAVVGKHHDQRVVQFSQLFQIAEQPPDVMVGMLHEARKDLHHPRIQFLLVRRQLVPVRDVRVVTRKLGVFGHDAQFLLAFENPVAIRIPAVVELALVLVRPLLGNLMRRMVRARSEIQEERFVGRHLLGVAQRTGWPCRPGLRSGDSLAPESSAARSGGCHRPGRDNTDACRRRGSRSSAGNRGPAASDHTAPLRWPVRRVSGAICLLHTCCTRSSAEFRRGIRSRRE